MNKNVFFFTWLWVYSLKNELSRWKESFIQKYGGEWIYIFRNGEIDATQFRDALLWWGFFSQKSLVIVYWIPKDWYYGNESYQNDSIEHFLIKHFDELPNDNILILVSFKPDKRTKWYKFFSKQANLKTFSPLDTPALLNLIKEKTEGKIKTWDIKHILESVWENASNLTQECSKLVSYAQYHKKDVLTQEDIDNIIVTHTQSDNFKVIDWLVSDPKKALEYIEKAQEQHTNIFELMWMMFRWLKLLIWITHQLEQGVSSSKEVATSLKIHPFPVKKHMSKSKELLKNKNNFCLLYHDLLSIDWKIKTGKLPWESQWSLLKTYIYERMAK